MSALTRSRLSGSFAGEHFDLSDESSKKQEEEPDKGNTPHKVSNLLLLSIFVCTLLIPCGFGFQVDYPQSLTDPLITTYNITTWHVNFLYSLYSIPNIVIAPFYGLLVAKIGMGNGLLLATFLMFSGSFLMTISEELHSYPVLAVGRVIFSIGGENMVMTWMGATSKWFSGRFLTVAAGCNQTFLSLVCGAGNYLLPTINAKYRSLGITFF